MTAKVEDRVSLWLSAHPGSTLVEIARGVHAKDATVREVLGGPLFTFSLSGKSYRYWLRGSRETSRDEVRRAETDCDFLLRVLSDGEAHSLNEILRRSFSDRGCGLTVHSRAADLRARGYRINNWKDGQRGDGSKYRMLLGVEERVGETPVDPGVFPVRRSTVPTTPASSTPSSPALTPDLTTAGVAGGQDAQGAAPDQVGQMTLTGGSFTKQRRAA